MVESKKTNVKKIILLYVAIMLCAFFIAFLIQYILTGSNFFEGLGLLPKDECSGSLSISNTGCVFKAKISLHDCIGKTYEVREDTCSGNLRCEEAVYYDSVQSTCGWKDSSGNHEYVLCVEGKLKDSASISC